MTLNVSGAQGVVSGALTVNLGHSTGEILVFTTASTADYTAMVTLSLVSTCSIGGGGLSGGFVLPGPGGGGSSDGSVVSAFPGAGVSVTRSASFFAMAASSELRVGPGVSVKVPWAYLNQNSGSASVNYIINYHVAYVRHP